jgi:hypothetical protein
MAHYSEVNDRLQKYFECSTITNASIHSFMTGQEELDSLALENSALRTDNTKLEVHFDAIVRAHDSMITRLQEANLELTRQLRELDAEMLAKRQLRDEINEVLTELMECGIKMPSNDLARLSQLLQGDVPAQVVGGPLDTTICEIIHNTPFFRRRGCRTHGGFVMLCEELVRSVEGLRAAVARGVETDYAAKLRHAQIEFQRDAAEDLIAMRSVMDESDSLISQRNDLVRTPPRGALSIRFRSPERVAQTSRRPVTPNSTRF